MLELTVLTDNNTLIDNYCVGEPGLSFFLDADGQRILFDLGYSDVFLQNARRLSVDPFDLDCIVLSHSHLDHSWGLMHWIREVSARAFEGIRTPRPTFVCHPAALEARTQAPVGQIGSLLDPLRMESYFELALSREPVQLSERLTFLGQIPRVTEFEAQEPIGTDCVTGSPDSLEDDSALVYEATEGLVIITGCSHSGICNTIEYASKLFGQKRIHAVIGGLHLFDDTKGVVTKTGAYLAERGVHSLYGCHCTSLEAKLILSRYVPVKEIGCGSHLSFQ